MNKKNKSSRSKPLVRWGIVLILAVAYLIFNTVRGKKDLELNGVENTAVVQAVDYVSFITDEKSGKRVTFYKVKIEYIFEMDTISKVMEIQPQTFQKKFDSDLKIGELIKIKHSTKNLENVKLVDQ